MADIVIVGGGFAGVWAAMSAVRLCRQAGGMLTVDLVSPTPDLVVRPRLYEADPRGMTVPLDDVLRPIGVTRRQGEVVNVDSDRHTLGIRDQNELPYRKLIVASGSTVRRPSIPGAEYLHDVDSLAGAVALEEHLKTQPMSTVVVVGSGFTGIEVACELADRARVMLVERSDLVAPDLGVEVRAVVESALAELGVEVRTGASVVEVEPDRVRLSDGSAISAGTVVWCAGVVASPLVEHVPGVVEGGRLWVDRHLRASGDVFAAGDVASADAGSGKRTLPSCQHAIPMGKHAGHNAAAELHGLPLKEFAAEPYATCLDLGGAGAVFSMGWDRAVRTSGGEAKALKQTINRDRIYPPTGDVSAILAGGDPAWTWVRPS